MHLTINSEADWYAAPRRALMGDCDCGCDGACHDGGLGFMGGDVIAPMDAMAQAAQGETGPDFGASGWIRNAADDVPMITSGQVSASAFSTSCAGMAAPPVNLFQTVSGLALGTSAAGVGILSLVGPLAGTVAIPVLGVVIAGVGAVVAIVDVIFAHHGAAVRQEQQLGCAAIAAGNNAIALIDQAVRAGQMKPSDAAAGLDAVVFKIASLMAPSIKHNPCNADCEVLVQFKAIAIYRKSLYAALGSAQQSSSSAALPAISSGGSVVPAGQTVPGGGGTLVPMNTSSGARQATTGTQVDLATGAVVQAAPAASAMPSWLGIAAAAALAFVLFK